MLAIIRLSDHLHAPEDRFYYEIEFSKLHMFEEKDLTVIDLWVYCYFDNALISKYVWAVNSIGMSISH
jgi:hypothetical protein